MEEKLPPTFEENICLSALRVHTVLHDRYEILQVVGSGGFSITYKAMDLLLGGSVAVKELFPQSCAGRAWPDPAVIMRGEEGRRQFERALARFREEATLTAQFQGGHNIVNVIDFCEENGTAYLIMEFLEGVTLNAHLRSLPEGRFDDAAQVLPIACAVAEALSAVHRQGVIHRDISPANIFLCANGGVKLIDFGAARRMGQRERDTVVVKTGCTPPEQYRERGRQGPQTDLYAWGATVYRMLTGVYPEPAPDRLRSSGELAPVSDFCPGVPAYLERLVERCLALDIHLRPESAGEVLRVLKGERLLQPVSAAGKARRRRQTILFALTGLCALLLAAAGLLLAGKTDNLYHAAISPCTLSVQLPEGLSSMEGLAALERDFEEMYPQIDLRLSAEEGGAALFPGGEGTYGKAELKRLRQLQPEGGLYEEVVAYDAPLVYGNTAKAAALGVGQEALAGKDIPPALLAASYEEFTGELGGVFYQGSVSDYRQVQRDLAGLYTVSNAGEAEAVEMSMSDTLDSNTETAALRFLLYLTGERAQELLFVEHGGMLPANRTVREKFFQLNNELCFLRD